MKFLLVSLLLLSSCMYVCCYTEYGIFECFVKLVYWGNLFRFVRSNPGGAKKRPTCCWWYTLRRVKQSCCYYVLYLFDFVFFPIFHSKKAIRRKFCTFVFLEKFHSQQANRWTFSAILSLGWQWNCTLLLLQYCWLPSGVFQWAST